MCNKTTENWQVFGIPPPLSPLRARPSLPWALPLTGCRQRLRGESAGAGFPFQGGAAAFVPLQEYCKDCAARVRRKKEAERQRKRYHDSTHLGAEKAL